MLVMHLFDHNLINFTFLFDEAISFIDEEIP